MSDTAKSTCAIVLTVAILLTIFVCSIMFMSTVVDNNNARNYAEYHYGSINNE